MSSPSSERMLSRSDFELSFRVKHVVDVTVMKSPIADWDLFVLERDGGKVKDNPIMAIL